VPKDLFLQIKRNKPLNRQYSKLKSRSYLFHKIPSKFPKRRANEAAEEDADVPPRNNGMNQTKKQRVQQQKQTSAPEGMSDGSSSEPPSKKGKHNKQGQSKGGEFVTLQQLDTALSGYFERYALASTPSTEGQSNAAAAASSGGAGSQN
jgi:hypothetical protein